MPKTAVTSTFDVVIWLTDRALNDGESLQPVKLQPLKFSHGVRRLSMALTRINHTDSPKQTTFWTLEGSETKRSCVAKPACK